MVNVKGLFEDTVEKVEKGISDQTKTIASSAKGQVMGSVLQSNANQRTNESGQANPAQAHSDQTTKEFVKDLYAPSEQSVHSTQQSKGSKKPDEFVKEQIEAGKMPEEAVQLQSLRKKLHDETYYIPLTQRKPHEQEVKEEEQKEEEQKMEDLQKKEEEKQKKQPMAVTMGQNKAEQFPGASG